MKIVHLWIVCLSLGLLACSPYSKEAYLENFEDFTSETRENCHDYSERDWNKRNARMSEFIQDEYPEYEEELTAKEKARIWAQTLSYYACQYQEEFAEKVRNADDEDLQKLKESMELMTDASEEFLDELIPELERIAPELRKTGEELVQKLEDNGVLDQLEESLHRIGKKLEEIDLDK